MRRQFLLSTYLEVCRSVTDMILATQALSLFLFVLFFAVLRLLKDSLLVFAVQAGGWTSKTAKELHVICARH